MSNLNEKALLASYRVAFRVAEAGKPHSIAENLILPAALDIAKIMFGKQEVEKLKSIPLSDNTIQRRISNMATDVRDQVIEKIKKSSFMSLQFDESTDIAGCAQFVAFVHFESHEILMEEILFCKALPKNATGQFLHDMFVEATQDMNIDWAQKCIAICSDGAKAMIGAKSGFIARLKEQMPNACWMHCFLHRQALAAKTLPQEYSQVLNIIINIVNSIKGKALQTRLFRIICEDMGALHRNLLYHTEVRWLSKGKVLTRVMELRAELLVYLQQAKSHYSEFISDPEFLLKLAFLSDLFEHLNNLNKSLQGQDENVITAKDKLHSFIKKIELWSSSINQNNFDSFSSTQSFIEEVGSEININSYISGMKMVLDNLKKELCHYFSVQKISINTGQRWILNPFLNAAINEANLATKLKENLLELSADGMLHLKFKSENLDTFWLKRKTEYPELTTEALKCLIPFSTSYLCELAFSSMAQIKSKLRNRLNLENDLILKIAKTDSRWEKLIEQTQAQPSH
ncbi:zinc finger BED domain-containing protein 5-like [Onthophagus taurus]|uniref:zinc finger BED domain-containing protein 5-like n=1 Tax=Onthophagus taurus TaxID=166361 RepID=UPI0039BDC757